MAKKYSETHQIPSYNCDTMKNIKIPTMVRMLITISGAQSANLGVSDEFVGSFNLGWIIIQHDVFIKRLPQSGEKITLTTEAESYNKFFCYRNFWIHDEEGNECVLMKTTFALMNLVERKMGSVLDEIIAPFESEKIKRVKRAEKIHSLDTVEGEKEYFIRYYDIDGNKHVNNSVYLDWVMDAFDFEFLTSYRPEVISIKFNKEMRYGDVAKSQWQKTMPESTHKIVSGDTVNAEANIKWTKIN